MTRGEYLVGINFNPSSDDLVSNIKRKAADLIDLFESIPSEKEDLFQQQEILLLKEVSVRSIETAAMYAVKAATKPSPLQ